MKKKIAYFTALAITANITAIFPIVSKAQNGEYTIGNDYVLGIEENCSVDDFLAKINITGNVYESDGITIRDGAIQNGDVLETGDKQYKLETVKPQNRMIINDTFDDGTIGKWTWGKNDMVKITVDEETNSNVLSYDATGASDTVVKSIDSRRQITESMENPNILIHEFDFKFPIISNEIVGIIMRNSADKYLATLRLLNQRDLYVLTDPGYASLNTSVAAGTWYHAKYIMDLTTGKMDMYIGNKQVADDMVMQAVKNSPGNYIPTQFSVGASNIKRSGIILSLDNITLYEPKPIKISGISWIDNCTENKDMRAIPVDNGGIKVYFACDTEIDKDSVLNGVGIYAPDGSKVSTETTYNEETKVCTIRINELLSNEADYTIKVDSIKDTQYSTEYTAEYDFSTDSTKIPFLLTKTTAEFEGDVLTDMMKLRTETEKIKLYFNIQSGNEIDTTDIDSKIGIFDEAGNEVSTSGEYADKCYTLTLNQPLTANKKYFIKINGLTDTLNQIPYNKEIEICAVASWVVDAGDIVYSDVYTVGETSISNIPCGTDVSSIWQALNVLPGTVVEIYTDNTLADINTGLIQDGNVITATNEMLGYNKQYTLHTSGCYIESDIYNIGLDYIMNIPDETEVSDFLSNIIVHNADSYGIYDNNSQEKTTGIMENTDTFTVSKGSQQYSYAIKTHKHDARYYINDDFEDGTKGAWTNGAIATDTDAAKNNYISWSADGATENSPVNISSVRTFEINDNPDMLIWETDFKTSTNAKTTISNYMYNSKGKILSNIRMDEKGQLGALIPNAVNILMENMQNKWYHAKYIMDCKNGQMNTYIDDRLVGEGLKFQAPDDFKPVRMTVGATGVKTSGFVYALDNIKVYEPNPVKVNAISFEGENNVNYDTRKVAYNTDNIVLNFSCENGYNIKNRDMTDCVKLLNQSNEEIKIGGTYNEQSGEYKIILKENLDKNSKYTIKIEGVRDDVYQKVYNEDFDFYTSGETAKIKNVFLINASGDMSDQFTSGAMTMYVPVINTGEAKTLDIVMVLYDGTSRAVKCLSSSVTANEKSLAEAFFEIDLNGIYTEGMYAKLYLKERGNGPLSRPYVIE